MLEYSWRETIIIPQKKSGENWVLPNLLEQKNIQYLWLVAFLKMALDNVKPLKYHENEK